MSQVYTLNNLPDNYSFWKSLGGNFDSLIQIIDEFVDNSISSLLASSAGRDRIVRIGIEQVGNDNFKFKIQDSGPGIQDLKSAFTMGNSSGKMSSLNEHGFGMKHALAAANPTNDEWTILTKSGSKDEYYYKLSAPYVVNAQKVEKIFELWPGSYETGTIVEFKVNRNWMNTLVKGIKGNYTKSTLNTFTDLLLEDLGYTYGTFISEGKVQISVDSKNLMGEVTNANVSQVLPDIEETIAPGIGSVDYDLGGGNVKLSYEFVFTKESSKYRKHYKANMASTGVEIRLNGRIMASNLFTEIWGREKHNSYNGLLIRINLNSKFPDRLPSTSTTKSGIQQNDPKLESLYRWIREKMSDPVKRDKLADHEVDLFKRLKELDEKTYRRMDPSSIVDTEKGAYTRFNENIRIDLYESVNGKVTIFEGKKDKTKVLDIYQLLMYWDGLTVDGIEVAEADLVATSHPESVRKIVNYKNQSLDVNGRKYNITLKTWKDLNVDYPN